LLKTNFRNLKNLKGYLHLFQNIIFGKKQKIILSNAVHRMTADNVKPSHADFLLGHSVSKLRHDIMYNEQAVVLKTDCIEQAIASALNP